MLETSPRRLGCGVCVSVCVYLSWEEDEEEDTRRNGSEFDNGNGEARS